VGGQKVRLNSVLVMTMTNNARGVAEMTKKAVVKWLSELGFRYVDYHLYKDDPSQPLLRSPPKFVVRIFIDKVSVYREGVRSLIPFGDPDFFTKVEELVG